MSCRPFLPSSRALRRVALTLLPAGILGASSMSASLSGFLRDDQGRPLSGAQVRLLNRISGYAQERRTGPEGTFAFHNVPFNTYHLEAFAPGMGALHQDVELYVALPKVVSLRMKTQGATVTVEETLSLVEDHPSVHLDIDRSTIALSPSPVRSRAMESILLNTPGFVANDNGRFHVRGSHGQLTYLIDGVPLSDHTHASHSNSLDPAQVESLEVITGGISAEYGGKPLAVVNLTTRSGLGTERGLEGEVSAGLASGGTRELGTTLRGGTSTLGGFLTGAVSRSGRFLDPPVFGNLHNTGHTGRLFARLDWLPSDRDALRLSLGGGRTTRDVPNLPSQASRGQNQRVETGDLNVSLAWSRLLGPDRSLEAALYHRHATARLSPTRDLSPGFPEGGPDQPVWAAQERRLDNWGLQGAYSQRFPGGSTLKGGLQYVTFPLEERFRFAITRDGLVEDPDLPLHAYTPAGGGAIWSFHAKERPSLASAFLQNDVHLGNLTLALGLRFDRYAFRDLRVSELQPRLGAAYRFEATRTILRASYDRLLATPDRENLGLSSSHEAAELGEDPHGTGEAHDHGVHVVRPEIQDAWSVGIEQQLGSWGRLAVEAWGRNSRNMADVEQFLDTGVEFPIAFAHGRSRGWTLRLDMAPSGGWSGFLSLGRTRAQVEGPMVGGLGLHLGEQHEHGGEAGGFKLIDHDQKLSGQAGLRFERGGFHAQVQTRYDSGLVAGDPEAAHGNPDLAFGLEHIRWDAHDGVWRVKPRTIWNLSAGHRVDLGRRRSLEFSTDLLNATDRKTLYNFLSHRGGTHVHPERTWALRVKLGF